MAFDPSINFNEGFYDLFEIVLAEGSLPNPKFPAALSNRLNTHTRFFGCQAGALGQHGEATWQYPQRGPAPIRNASSR